jgi:hypothetical protein
MLYINKRWSKIYFRHAFFDFTILKTVNTLLGGMLVLFAIPLQGWVGSNLTEQWMPQEDSGF